MPRTTWTLTEREVKQAIAHYCSRQGSLEFDAQDVHLSVEENRDFADRPTGGFSVTAKADARTA